MNHFLGAFAQQVQYPVSIRTVQVTSETESALQFCERTMAGFCKKADHNKSEALRCSFCVIFCTLAAPMFITLGSGLVLGKVVPSVLSLIAAGCTAWLQQRKPQQLWSLYRGAQRELEDQQTKYRFRIGDYELHSDPDKLLAERVAAIALHAHQQWLPTVPNPDKLNPTPTLDGGRLEHFGKKRTGS
jgi:hypothetical protein